MLPFDEKIQLFDSRFPLKIAYQIKFVKSLHDSYCASLFDEFRFSLNTSGFRLQHLFTFFARANS